MITQQSIDALKERLDVVSVIEGYLELKRNGANYKAPCPFHDEKTASFVVSPAKQIYHCFGCNAGGDAVKFVMEYEHLTYPEALEKLAAQHNVTLERTVGSRPEHGGFKLLGSLAEFYRAELWGQSDAKQYLKARGVSQESVERFGIGWAGPSARTLSMIKSHLFSAEDAVAAGALGGEKERKYARFIERIVFPIRSASGKVCGFGGRTISDHPAKYVNSPDGPCYSKSRLLYGYFEAKDQVFKKRVVVVVEGYLDVVMLHQAQIRTAVATCGTALTEQHLALLCRGNPRVLCAFDGDAAGRAAAFKAAKMMAAQKIESGVVLWPEGQDPASMVQAGRISEVIDALKHPTDPVVYVLEHLFAEADNALAKERAYREADGFLQSLGEIFSVEYGPKLRELCGLLPTQTPERRHPAKGEAAPSAPKPTANTPALGSLLVTLLEHPELYEPYRAPLDELANPAIALAVGGKAEAIAWAALDARCAVLERSAFEAQLRALLHDAVEAKLRTLPQRHPGNLAAQLDEADWLRHRMQALREGRLV